MPSPDESSKYDRLHWLAEIYLVYAPELQRYIFSKVGEFFLAEDLTSAVFLKALRWLKEDQSQERIRGWLYSTVRTTIADYWQVSGQYELQTLDGMEELLASQLQGTALVQDQAELRVQHLLSLLPERERQVLTLRYLHGYSAAEVASVLGINAGHIRVLQLRALRRAAQLEEQERNVVIMQEQTPPFETSIPFLSPESLKVHELAQQEAQTLGHSFVGTEHQLWGLASEGSLNTFLAPLGITPERVHAGIVFIYNRQGQWPQPAPQGPSSPETLPEALKGLTPRAKQVIVLASEEAKAQGEKSIRPSHLLLGLVGEGAGIGAGLLRALGVNLGQARAALAPADASQTCSFCGRTGALVKRIFPSEPEISGNPSSFICNICVEKFHGMLK